MYCFLQHWDTIVKKFREEGSNLGKDKIQAKFRKLKSAYFAVKGNNGKTG
jgi:hypothetical protein